MKKILLAIMALAVCIGASAQGQIKTKRFLIKDFREKVTKIVIPGTGPVYSALSQEVVDRWTISAFEFCTPGEFDKLKTSEDYFFLLFTEGSNSKGISSGVTSLTLVKGGSEASKGVSAMTKVVSMPICSATASGGRELTLMGAFVEIIQAYTLKAIESEKDAYSGLAIFNRLNMNRDGYSKQMLFSEDDMDPRFTEAKRSKYMGVFLKVEPEADVDEAFTSGSYGTLVSYVVAPAKVSGDSYAYKMLIESGTGKLYYFNKEKIRSGQPYGFNENDLKRIKSLSKR